MLVAPDDLVSFQIDREHLVLVSAVVRTPAGDRRRRPRVGAGGNREHFLAVADADRPQDFVAARDVGDPIDDCRRGMNVALGLDLPQQLSVLRTERVEMRIVRPDQDAIAGDDRRRLDLTRRLEGPHCLAGRGVHRVHHAAEVADVDNAVRDRRRGFADPFFRGLVFPSDLAVGQADRVKLARLCPDVNDAIGDRGGGLDGLSGLVGPEHPQLVGHRRSRGSEKRR
jgi:hypothetical protein